MSYRVVREPFGANWEEWVASLVLSHAKIRVAPEKERG